MVDSCSADSGFYIQFLPLFNVYTLNSITQNMGGNIYWVPSAGNWNFLHGVFHSIKVPITIHIDEPYVPLVSIIMPTCADSEDGLIAWYTPDEVWYNHLDSLNAGQHTIEIDYGQCTWRDTLLLVEQEVLILDSVQVLPAACISLNNGSLTPYYTTNAPSVTWAIGDSAINGNLAAGSYPINLTSAAGCQISDTIYIPLQIELPSFSGDSAFFCSSEHLNYESFTEQWLFNEWTLTSWDINTTEDSLIIHYMHPNGCTMEHPLELIWIEEPIPMVDTAYTINENWVAWNVALESNFDFNIYWEDGTDLWNNIHPCDDSTYFVLQYQNICAWTFPVATLCVVNEIDEHQELDMEWLFCSNQLSNDMGYCGEIIVFNSLGQSIFLGSTSNGIFLTSASQPRWVKTKEKIYPIRWCLKD